jgi:vancomycin resistance protein YoaR
MADEKLSGRPVRRGDRRGRSVLSVKPKTQSRRTLVRVAAVAGAIAALLLLLASIDVVAAWGKVHPGVTVGGVDVGGMSRGEARSRLEKTLGPRLAIPVKVVYGQKNWTVAARQIDATLPAGDLIEGAYSIGRKGGFGSQAGQRVSAWFGGSRLPAAATADPSAMATLTSTLGRSVYVAPIDAGVKIDGVSVQRVKAEDGVRMDTRKAEHDLLSAFLSEDRQVTLSAVTAPVSVVDGDAEQAFLDAKRMANGEVTVTWEKQQWRIPAETVTRWIAFRKVPRTSAVTSSASAGATTAAAASPATSTAGGTERMLLQAYMDPKAASTTLMPMVGDLGRPAVDARFEISGRQVAIVPSQEGLGVDIPGLCRTLDVVLRGTGPRASGLNMTRTEPRLTTAKAKTMGVREYISGFSTDYDSGNEPRVNNIHTLAKALDGKLVEPGGTFSFNDAIGERTAEKGYQEAPAIVNGKLVPQLGGGICQIGTTIFNAVFFSGFPVVERTNHSFYISHYPKGRDATVTWGGPDFRFKNDSPNWVLIHTGYDSSSVTISLYGTNPGYKVDYTTGDFTNIVHFSTSEEKDPTLPAGSRVAKDSGVDGRRVVVVRTVTLNGQVVRKDTFTSLYKPKQEVVRVGTAPLTPIPPGPGTTPTPTAPPRG